MRATTFHDSIHVAQTDIYPAIAKCPICLFQGPRQPVFTVQTSPTIEMLECPHCGGCSASHMPKASVLDEYYSRYYDKSDIGTTTPNTKRMADAVLSALTLANGVPIRILDFGGGDGSVGLAIARNILDKDKTIPKVEVDVVDYGEVTSVECADITLQGHRDIASLSGKYNLIMASAVLEHIPEAHETIMSLLALSAPGSYFYARTPYMIPLARLLGKFDLTYPAHVHDLGASFWNKFIATFGISGDIVVSRPSVIESVFSTAPARTIAAFLMKLPARLELFIRRSNPRAPLWKFVGGWEVVLRFR